MAYNQIDLSGDVTLYINDREAMSVNSVTAYYEEESLTEANIFLPKSLTFNNKDCFNNFLENRKYNFVAEGYFFPKGKYKMPKKKRIRQKWMKKYYSSLTVKGVELKRRRDCHVFRRK